MASYIGRDLTSMKELMARVQILRAFKAFLFALLIQAHVLGQQPDPAPKIYAQAAKSVLVIVVKSPNGQVVTQDF